MNDHIMRLSTFRGQRRIADLHRVIDERGYIGGSYAAWMVSPYAKSFTPNDIDVFAKSNLDAEMLVSDFREKLGFWVYGETEVAVTMKRAGRKDVQIVKPSPEWATFPDDVVESFDLDICRAIVITPDECLADCNAGSMFGKVLRINNPLRTLKRILKYQQRGVVFEDHEILKVFQAWEATSPERKQQWLDRALSEMRANQVADSGDWDYDDDDWWEGE